MITNSRIGHGDMLGAQMTTLANLIYLSEINNQELVFWDELKNFRRGYQFLDVFVCDGIRICKNKKIIIRKFANIIKRIDTGSWFLNMKMAYFSKGKYYKDRIIYECIRRSYGEFEEMKGMRSGKNCDTSLIKLDPNRSYDIIDGFGTYQDWKKVSKRVEQAFIFKESICEQGDAIFNSFELKGMSPVSVHFRLADYLVLSSLNLSLNYYKEALKQFEDNKTIYLVFSDEIEKVKEWRLFENKNVIYMSGNNSAAIDMFLMTKCSGGNIIANSTFSFWGAYLNKSANKKVVCPKNFVGKDTPVNYLNGNYYPEEWIAIGGE